MKFYWHSRSTKSYHLRDCCSVENVEIYDYDFDVEIFSFEIAFSKLDEEFTYIWIDVWKNKNVVNDSCGWTTDVSRVASRENEVVYSRGNRFTDTGRRNSRVGISHPVRRNQLDIPTSCSFVIYTGRLRRKTVERENPSEAGVFFQP